MWNEAVNEAMVSTFEQMAFLDISPGGSSPEVSGEGPVLYLPYSLPVAGAFSLFLPKEVKFQVAEAIYGESWNGLSTTQLDDSLLELMNVLVGRILSLRFGPHTTYAMGLPTVLYDPPTVWPGAVERTFPFHRDENEFTLVWYEMPNEVRP